MLSRAADSPAAAAAPASDGGRQPPLPRSRRLTGRSAYAGAAALAGVAVAATMALERTAGPTFFGLVLTAVAASVWLGGLGPGLVATAVTGAGMVVVIIEPVGEPAIADRSAAIRWALFVMAALVITGLGHVMRSARDRAETSERNLAIVSRVHEALEPSLAVEERLRRLTEVVVPELGDWCAARVEDDVAATPPHAAGLLALPDVARPELVEQPDAAMEAAQGGDAPDAAVDRPTPSIILAPLQARGNRIGVLALARFSGRPPFGPDDVAVAEEVARRSALQIENARLYEAARSLSASLERSDALKTAMLRGASHEFRTPLTAIAAAATALERVEGEERAQMIALVVDETQRLERLVANLLDLSRLDGGVLQPRLDHCSVAELVEGARSAAARSLAPGDVRVSLDVSGPLVRADPVLTERILVNLLQNAKRHGAPPIAVTAARRGDAVEIIVADDGPGVSEAMRQSLFDPFTSSGGGGIGLGLALSRRLAEAQGAELILLDRPHGASFALRLPLAPEVP